MALAATDAEGQARLAAFLQGLQEYGWAVGRNMRIDIRWAAGNADDIRKYAAELVALAPDVIPVSGGTAVRPLLQLTRTVPVVFTQTFDPVSSGLVASLARRGGNATDFTGFGIQHVSKIFSLVRYCLGLLMRRFLRAFQYPDLGLYDAFRSLGTA